MIRGLLVLCLIASAWGSARAHELRPAYLDLRETTLGNYNVIWSVPARGNLRLALYVRLPASCVTQAEVITISQGNAILERWSTVCNGTLKGQTVHIDGLSSTLTDGIARISHRDGTIETFRVTADHPSFAVAGAQSAFEVAHAYVALGIEHILFGLDHLLFVLGLVLLVGDWKRLAMTVTTFTLAHSITLAAATIGIVHVPQRLVETWIALSILFLAVEVARSYQGERGFTSSHPWLVAFSFGLLHGLGFASGLTALGLPQTDIPTALLSFNIGVEAGQIGCVGLILLLRYAINQIEARWASMTATASCYLVGVAGAYWSLERMVPQLWE